MSVSRSEKDATKVTPLQKTTDFILVGTQKFLAKPAHILFYIGLAGLMVGLFFGREFDWKFYAVVGALGIFSFFNSLETNK